MSPILDDLFSDHIASTLRTFGNVEGEPLLDEQELVALDRHLANLIADPPTDSAEPMPPNSIILKPLSRLFREISGEAPGTKAFANSRLKKGPKKGDQSLDDGVEKEEERDPDEAKGGGGRSRKYVPLKDRWAGSDDDLSAHLDQVASFNLAHLLFEEEGKRDQGEPVAVRYFNAEEANQVMTQEGEEQRSSWEAGLGRPDKSHLELIGAESTGKTRKKWTYWHVHLGIPDWGALPRIPPVATKSTKPETKTPKRESKEKVVKKAAPKKVAKKMSRKASATGKKGAPIALPKQEKSKGLPQESPEVQGSEALVQPPKPKLPQLLYFHKDAQGKDLPQHRRYFLFDGQSNPKARLSLNSFVNAKKALGQPNAEWVITTLLNIPQAFIEAARPRTIVEVIKEAEKQFEVVPTIPLKLRRKTTEQRDIEMLAQILINLEPSKPPKQLGVRLKELMERDLEKAVGKAEEWEEANGRDKKGYIRQRKEKVANRAH